ncbi:MULTISPECIES: hypothetical protein [Pseudomonas]|uniref:Uncharacterized protein n=1 Tax=Pseudomonas salomonii TaxID=191391 RepID=A0A3M4Q301_9PSED|nr:MULTISPECIES: hypothetical protein [Pseudomonas]RMQ84797.1 hypothetical protein ALP97_01439 [Pseudomonas salomonii]
MPTVFISGSIKIKSLDDKVKSRLDSVMSSGVKVLIGDAGGVDKSVQQYLIKNNFSSVTVYCTGNSPRNNDGSWPVVNVEPPVKTKSRAYFTAKDLKMADDSDFGLMVWDCKSTGTLSNVIELLKKKKKSVVYVSSRSAFLNVSSVSDLQTLVNQMDYDSFVEADKKISLNKTMSMLAGVNSDESPETEVGDLKKIIEEHKSAIARHEKSITDLELRIEEMQAPIDDMFAKL